MPAKKTTILAADDDPQLLRLMTRNLQLEGYDVLAASDGELALQLIESNSPDLVVLDVMIPGRKSHAASQHQSPAPQTGS